MEARIRVRLVVFATTIALAGSLAGTAVTASPEDDAPEAPVPEVVEPIAQAEPDAEPADGRALYVRPALRQGHVGDLRQFTAWLCDVPAAGASPFGADERPLTRDDDCHRVLKARWTVSDRSGARLLTATGPLVKAELLTAGADVTVTAKRGDRAGTATLEVLEPGEEPTPATPAMDQPKTAKPKPSAVKPSATATPGPLLGTIGFRSAAPKFRGRYVSTYIKLGDFGGFYGRDHKLKARKPVAVSLPENGDDLSAGQLLRQQEAVVQRLTLELGLFKAGKGRFKLLGENGRWVRLDEGVFQATGSSWGNAWAFQAIRPFSSSEAVCLKAYKNGKPKGLVKLKSDTNPVLSLEWTTRPGNRCKGTKKLALFLTDDLPKGAKLSSMLLKPGIPVDALTRVRFVPPDGPAKTLTYEERDRALDRINGYFASHDAYLEDVYEKTDQELGWIMEGLGITNKFVEGQEPKSIDWLSLAFDVAGMFTPFAPDVKIITKLFKGDKWKKLGDKLDDDFFRQMSAAALPAIRNVTQVGIDMEDNAQIKEKDHLVPGIANKTIEGAIQLHAELEQKHSDEAAVATMMRTLIVRSCSTPEQPKTCTDDRRLAQWLKYPPRWRVDSDQAAMRERMGWIERILRELVPHRGVMVPVGRTQAAENTARPFYLWEDLGDRDASAFNGFGDRWNGSTRTGYVAMSSVWHPFHVSDDRPQHVWWAIRMEDDGGLTSEVNEYVWDWLFKPRNLAAPTKGGLGLSYKDVACGWLVNDPGLKYGYPYGAGQKWYTPCHFSWGDPSSEKYKLVNNPDRWKVNKDDKYLSEYNKRWTAFMWWVPDRKEVAEGRDRDDPDIFSWQIPHLEWDSAARRHLPGSSPTGEKVRVYFANLTNAKIKVFKLNAWGNRKAEPDLKVYRWLGIEQQYKEQSWSRVGHWGTPIYRKGTPGIEALTARVGDVFLVKAKDGDGNWYDTGTYRVKKPPEKARTVQGSSTLTYAVAEVHGHVLGDPADNILDMNWGR